MRMAFKEWAVVVEALAAGEQMLLLRKGGLREGTGGFAPRPGPFWFLPTRFHQQQESVTEAGLRHWTAAAAHLGDPARLRLGCLGEITHRWRLDSAEVLPSLAGFHVWRDDVLQRRFEWGQPGGVHALAVRVSRLPAVVDLPWMTAYDGCKSWVELERDVEPAGAQPVLGDEAYAAALARLAGRLGPGERWT